jgi:hypothetical protein
MKTFAALGTAFLFLLLTASVPPLKAQEHENESNGAKSEQQQDENRQPSAKPQEDRSRDQSTQEPRANRPEQERSDQERPRQADTTHPQHEQHTPAQTEPNERRPPEAQRGKRIPDDRFRANFGPPHKFRVRRQEVINNPRPVITYVGYSFELLEPWPAEWSFDDDCYIDYVDDQYYLFNPFHPGMRIALIVVNVD